MAADGDEPYGSHQPAPGNNAPEASGGPLVVPFNTPPVRLIGCRYGDVEFLLLDREDQLEYWGAMGVVQRDNGKRGGHGRNLRSQLHKYKFPVNFRGGMN